MIKDLKKTTLKYVIAGISGMVLIVALLFTVPIWTIPTAATETYMATETKQETYTENVKVELSKTPKEIELAHGEGLTLTQNTTTGLALCFFPIMPDNVFRAFKSVDKVYSINRTDALMFNSVIGRSITDCLAFVWTSNPWIFATLPYADPSIIKYGCGADAQNIRILVDWNVIQPNANKLFVAIIPDTKAKAGDWAKVTTWNLDTFSIANKSAASGILEFNINDGLKMNSFAEKFMIAYSLTRSDSGLLSTPCTFSSKVIVKWDDVVYGTKEITKTRDLPVQLEKQRTVIKEEKGSLWQLLFHK